MTKTIGICAHSYEGGDLCFLTVCREGASIMGTHMHPPIIVSAIPMGLSMPAWEADDLEGVGIFLNEGVEQLAKAGADFFICPDNTAHLVLEKIISKLPLPGLHIAELVCNDIVTNGWKKVALLGTKWTMNGPVYRAALESRGLKKMIPDESTQDFIHTAIFDELCVSIFNPKTIDGFVSAIETLSAQGAECVILGCTEIPLIITEKNSPLPILDSTRMLAKKAVQLAVSDQILPGKGWINF